MCWTNVPWLRRPVRTSVWARWRDGQVDLGVLEGDGRLRGEQLDQLELVVAEHPALAEALERQHADRAVARAQRHAHDAAVDRARRRLEDPVVVELVDDADGLVVREDPRRDARFAGVPGLQVVLRVDAPGDDRREQPRQLVDELDRDVVRADQLAQAVGDRPEQHRRVERRQDRLGDLEELALAAHLLLEGGRLLAQ